MVSTMYDRKEINTETGEKKPEIVCFYNQTKGVDMVEQMSNYSVARKPKRGPLFSFIC